VLTLATASNSTRRVARPERRQERRAWGTSPGVAHQVDAEASDKPSFKWSEIAKPGPETSATPFVVPPQGVPPGRESNRRHSFGRRWHRRLCKVSRRTGKKTPCSGGGVTRIWKTFRIPRRPCGFVTGDCVSIREAETQRRPATAKQGEDLHEMLMRRLAREMRFFEPKADLCFTSGSASNESHSVRGVRSGPEKWADLCRGSTEFRYNSFHEQKLRKSFPTSLRDLCGGR